jgi:hypothetical protein
VNSLQIVILGRKAAAGRAGTRREDHNHVSSRGGLQMENQQVRNWFGSIVSFPSLVTEPDDVQDIIGIVQDKEKYPGPVRAVGSILKQPSTLGLSEST